jgi:hypothetical protein
MAELRQLGASQPLPSVRRDQYRVVQSDGRVPWLEAVNTVDLEDGEIVIRGGVRDITERRLAVQALERSHRRAELLTWTASSLLSTDDPWGLVEELCHKVMAELDCQVFANYLVDDDTGRLHLNAYAGIAEEDAQRVEWLESGEALRGRAARDACRVVVQGIPAMSGPLTALVARCGVTAYARHPLLVQDEVLGTLSFGATTRTGFDEDDLTLMKAVADHVAMVVHHWRPRTSAAATSC